MSLIVIELFLKGRKLNVSLVFKYQFCLKVPKAIKLIATQYFIIKTHKKRQLRQIASRHLSGTEFKDFMKIYKDYTKKVSSNARRFRKTLL